MTNSTIDYYQDNADNFFESTVGVDMSPLYARFLAGLPAGGHVLDAGCGSGRDAKAFLEAGYRVSAFDASAAMAARASVHSGIPVAVSRFEDFVPSERYDGIWACASLLHVGHEQLPVVFTTLWQALNDGGVLYVSFKHGDGEREQEGRYFADLTEGQLRDLIAPLKDVGTTETWLSEDRRADRTQVWVNGLIRKASYHRHKLTTGGGDRFLPKLAHEIARAEHIDISVSFIMASGLNLLMPDLRSALQPLDVNLRKPAHLRILTCDYLDVTDVEACRLLMLLDELGADVRIFESTHTSFHMKAWIFTSNDPQHGVKGSAFVGSSNISKQALQHGLEWNYRIDYPGDLGFLEARQQFEILFSHPQTKRLTHEWIDAYAQRRLPTQRPLAPGMMEKDAPPTPSEIQQRAMSALDATRLEGFRRGLVVLATGLGKTWLAAFDAKAMNARRILFVAHREEILDQAAQTFVRILPTAKVGYYAGKQRDNQADVLCASVQTLGREAHLERFGTDHFDYIVVDEFHHAAAPTYRRLLAYFNPKFLLGLTATPERSDQSDILSLCDDNLVFECGLFEGIRSQRLVPFHYYGIFDEFVDYAEIPWRNGRFDPEQLSNRLATQNRALHALKEWRLRKQTRTLAFCVSVRHAEYMANAFRAAGINAEAVYGGSSMGRAEALDALRDARLDVLFSVDLFNEGMDLPEIDTVMMLRPTESKVLFLQQLGRGLRLAPPKEKLVVLDFIGNHRSFLHKPQALLGLEPTAKSMAAFVRDLERQSLQLPEGCYLNFDLQIIDFLKSLDNRSVDLEYKLLRATLGRRPSMAEAYRGGISFKTIRQQYGSWFEMVAHMEDLLVEERELLEGYKPLLREIETTDMTKSFKMILLEAFQELDGWSRPPLLSELASRSWSLLMRRRALLSDLPAEFIPDAAVPGMGWGAYWQKYPVKAWVGGNTNAAVAYFEIVDDRFQAKVTIDGNRCATWKTLIQETIDYRLASYEQRKAATSNVTPIQRAEKEGINLPFYPNLKIACGHFKTGHAETQEYRSLGEGHGRLDQARHFIARASGNSMNGGKNPIKDGDYLLLEWVTPSSAGSITNQVTVIERQEEGGDNQYLLRVVLKARDGGYLLRANNPDYDDMVATEEMRTLARLKGILDPFDVSVGQTFAREDIPRLFGVEFNPGNWNSGHVILKEQKAHVLLVTLNKQGKSLEHRYVDHWIDERRFHWQSQNSTGPTSSKGRSIIYHEKEGWTIHLFVRYSKLTGGKGAPFVYEGRFRYVSHEGSEPMSVVFELVE